MNKVKKIKDLPNDISLDRVIFIHPNTKQYCRWISQWTYKDGGSGIWYKLYVEGEEESTKLYPLLVNNLQEALNYKIYKIL